MELIKIENENGKQAVSARELYNFLEVKTDFTNWCKRMFEYGFLDGQDYSLVKIGERNAHNKLDYALTLDTAKEISMLQRSVKGKQARQYFIECEKKLTNKPLSQIDLIIQSAIAIKEQDERISKVESTVKELESKVMTTNTDYYTIMGYCNLKGLNVDVKVCNVLGRKCTKRSKELGYNVTKAYSIIFGQVNAYHIDILFDVLIENNYLKQTI